MDSSGQLREPGLAIEHEFSFPDMASFRWAKEGISNIQILLKLG